VAAPIIRGSVAPIISVAPVAHADTAVGDLVLIWYWTQGAVVPSHALQGGGTEYIEIRTHSHDDGTTDGRLSVAYKIATNAGAQTYTAYVVTNGTANQTSAGTCSLQAGTFNVSSLPTNNSSTLTTSGVPNPPSLASLTGDFLVFACAGWHVTSAGATAVTAGANYTNLVQNASASHVTHLAWASRALTSLSAATEDPPAFGDNVTPNGSVSMTFAIKGAVPILGALAKTIDAPTIAAAGTVTVKGAADLAVGAVGLAAAGTVDIIGVVSVDLGAVSLSAEGTVEDADTGIHGELDATIGMVTLDAAGKLPIAGAAGMSIPALDLAAAGKIPIAGGLTATLGAVSLESAGTVDVIGQSATTIPAPALSAAGVIPIAGELAADIGEIALAAADQQPEDAQGDSAQTTAQTVALFRNRRSRR
jgi:hypothetical protein